MELIVFSGVQGAGKSTFYSQRFSHSHVRLSLDLVRTRNREDILLFACLAAQQPVVVDNTNPTAEQRARYARIARAAGFRAVLYFFDVTLEDALRRNAGRDEAFQIPEIGMRGTFAKLQQPTNDEPFDQFFRVSIAPGGAWNIEEMPR